MSRPFLTARWSNLLLFTFEVPEALVRAVAHPALEPDLWRGRAHVSLVAFDFLDTRVLGVRVPGLVNFPEINLRTYVRERGAGGRRGVQFVRELVPSRIIAAVARLRYNEPYSATHMRSAAVESGGQLLLQHRWRWRGRTFHLRAASSLTTRVPPADSMEHHFKEHEWGFGTARGGRLLRYRVEHPVWAVREPRALDVDVSFAALYGDRWAVLDGARPVSVVFAVGSAVKVFLPE
jgi:uncharacterized protein YqjF (DUF2071 family)